MILTAHHNCKTKKPHTPEVRITVKSIQEAIEKIKLLNKHFGIPYAYLNWHNAATNKSHYIVYPTHAENFKNYLKTSKTILIKEKE